MDAETQNQIHVQSLILQHIQSQFQDIKKDHASLEKVVREHMAKEEHDRLLLLERLHALDLRMKTAEIKIAIYVALAIGLMQFIPFIYNLWK